MGGFLQVMALGRRSKKEIFVLFSFLYWLWTKRFTISLWAACLYAGTGGVIWAIFD